MHVPLIELDLRMPMLGIRFDHVLFLDIDGVLHPDGPGDYDDFSCMPLFCEALRAADPQAHVPIVVSSAWRHTQRLDDIKCHFPLDVRERIVGVTPYLLDSETASTSSHLPGASMVANRHQRQKEIVAWVSRNAKNGQWLAVDDRASGFEDQCPHLFLVPGTTQDGGGPGITVEVGVQLRTRLEDFLQHASTTHATS